MMILLDTLTIVKSILLGGFFFIGGIVLSYFLWNFILRRKRDTILRETEAEGEAQKRDKMLQAKEKFLQLKTEHEKYINEKNSRIIAVEARLNQKEMQLSQKIEEQQRMRNELETMRENMNVQLGLWINVRRNYKIHRSR
jgi:ribonuclease Y